VVGAHRLDDVTHTSLVQTIALAEFAARRGEDATAGRRSELVAALQSIAANPHVTRHADDDPYTWASRALVDAVGRDDPAAAELRDVVRPLLLRHLDDDLAAVGPLLDAFRGRLRDA
jgi:plasmid stabilization system protein ParE